MPEFNNEICIIGAQFFAYHGFYEYEQLVGNEFEVDVVIHVNGIQDNHGEDLENTVDYEKVYRILENQMEHTAALMETVIYRFMNDVKKAFPQISHIKMSMKKNNPIPGAQLNHTQITINQSF